MYCPRWISDDCFKNTANRNSSVDINIVMVYTKNKNNITTAAVCMR